MPDSIWQAASSRAGRGREAQKQKHEAITVMSRGSEALQGVADPQRSTQELKSCFWKWVLCLGCPVMRCCCAVANACTSWHLQEPGMGGWVWFFMKGYLALPEKWWW